MGCGMVGGFPPLREGDRGCGQVCRGKGGSADENGGVVLHVMPFSCSPACLPLEALDLCLWIGWMDAVFSGYLVRVICPIDRPVIGCLPMFLFRV